MESLRHLREECRVASSEPAGHRVMKNKYQSWLRFAGANKRTSSETPTRIWNQPDQAHDHPITTPDYPDASLVGRKFHGNTE